MINVPLSLDTLLNTESQSFITFMDALKLRMRAKDQLHPILQELMTNYARFKASKDWEGRSRMVSWYVREQSNVPTDTLAFYRHVSMSSSSDRRSLSG